jgi:hypothetical protein
MHETRRPAVSVSIRISVEADQIRRKLEAKLDLSASKLIERALTALDRELKAIGGIRPTRRGLEKLLVIQEN